MAEFEQPWWSDWGDQIITRYSLKKTTSAGGGEWHGPCPSCGGKDRFWIKESEGLVKAFCRQGCSIADMADEMRCDGVWPSAEPIRAPNVVPLHSNPFAAASDDGGSLLYHERKQVDLLGAQLDGDNVVVPLFNTKRERVGYQRISPDGQKRFNAGLDKSGGDVFGVCGKLTEGEVWVAEGWATSAAVAMAMWPRPCIFALDAGTLPKVVEAVGKAFPELTLCVAADNDKKGIEAAKKSGRRWAAPEIEGDDWNDVFVRQGPEALRQGLQRAAEVKKMFTRVDQLQMTTPKWLVDGMIEEDALSMVFGASGSGKTFLALDVALSVAAGISYHGRDVSGGTVIFVAGEGHSGFARRVAAWKKARGVSLDGVPFFKSNTTVLLNDEDKGEPLLAELREIAEEAGTPKMIVLDTLDRTIMGDDSNGEDISLYLNVCDKLREEFNCTVMIVHHVGHQNTERARGSTRLRGRLDCEYRVESWGDNKLVLTATKMKDAEEPEPMSFMKVSYELETADGGFTSSLALDYTPDKPQDKKDPEYIKEVIMDQIRTVSAFGEAARNDLKEAVALELDCSQRTANRHIKKLIDKGVLALRGGLVVVA